MEDKDFTWKKKNPFIARRLDYCFATDNLLSYCSSCEHETIANSDHKAIMFQLEESVFQRGPGYWKFNNNLLKNTQFIEEMNNFLEHQTQNNTDNTDNNNLMEKWELLKVEIRNLCYDFGKRISCTY